jgi:hypothetical protein
VPLLRYAKVGPELLEMADEGLWCWRPGRRLGSGNPSLQPNTPRALQVVGVGDGGHQHAPFLERRASAHAGGGLLAASRPFFFALTRELDIREILRTSLWGVFPRPPILLASIGHGAKQRT